MLQFIVNGPNSALGSGSLLVLFEREVDYIVSCIDKMLRENYRTMSAKQGAVNGKSSSGHPIMCRIVV